MTPEQMADIVLDAAKRREASYDQKMRYYELDTGEAVRLATIDSGVDEAFWYPIYLAFHWFNDLSYWANYVKSGKPASEMFDHVIAEQNNAQGKGEGA